MVADARSAAIIPSEALESKACSSLYVGIAYGVGFGVEQNIEESLSWISSSADQGSTTASLILQILKNPESRHRMIMRAFHDSVDGQQTRLAKGLVGSSIKTPQPWISLRSRRPMVAIHCITFRSLRRSQSPKAT